MGVGMRKVALGFIIWLLMAALPGVALGQTSEAQTSDEAPPSEPIPATWELSVTAGAAGWIDPGDPVPVRVSISSDVLLVGRIEVVVGASTTSQAIEIPAGGVKDYFIEGAVPGLRRQMKVNLISGDGSDDTVLESQQVPLKIPAQALVVATVGADQFESAIRGATPMPLDQDVELVRLTVRDMAVLNSAVSYLVLPTDAMADLDEDAIVDLTRWIENGGRLIASATNASRIADPAAGNAFVGIPAAGVRLGGGEVVGVADFSQLDEDGWSTLLRSLPQPGIVRVQQEFGGDGASLISSALAGRSASVPALPWLLLGILLFVVLVGPVNFIVLRSFGKPEWAWFTVPVLSALFVAGFWLVGRAQLQPFTVTHSSVVVEDGRGAEGHTAFVVQVESGGDHSLRFEEGWSPEGQALPGTTPGVVDIDDSGRAAVNYELEDLGVGTAQGRWTSDTTTSLDFSLAPTENGFDVTVTNKSDNSFHTWGVVVDGQGWISSDELVAGNSGTVAARPSDRRNSRYEPIIMEAVQRRGFRGEDFYGGLYQEMLPMTMLAEQLEPRLDDNGVHFFGFTDNNDFALEFDGKGTASAGLTLLVVEIPEDGSILAARSAAKPELLAVEGASSVEQYFEEIYAYGADALYFHYTVPDGIATAKVSPGFTSLDKAEIFDWGRGEFVGFEWGEPINLPRFVSPTGDVVVKAGRDAEGRFFDDSIFLSRFSLDWS